MTAWLAKRWRGVALTLVVAVGLVRAWLARRQLAAAERRTLEARAERDAARGDAAVAARRAELVEVQAHNDAAGAAAAEEFARVPTTGSPADRVRALDAAARRLSGEDDPGARAGDGGAPAVPPPR